MMPLPGTDSMAIRTYHVTLGNFYAHGPRLVHAQEPRDIIDLVGVVTMIVLHHIVGILYPTVNAWFAF